MINTPFTLPCGAILANRVAKAALTERLAKSNHLPNALHQTLYDHWADYGAGLLISGNILVDKRYLESTGNIVIEHYTKEEPFKKWIAAITQKGNHFWAQLSHAGRQSSIFSTRKPVSASDIQLKKMGLFAKPKALSGEGIEDVIQRFVFAASFCQRVGFTGVQFHAAHGYLISQFLSPKTNKRTDEWGGTIENRARLLFDVIDKTRKEVGNDYPISVKLNSADFQRGGFNEEDSKYVIKGLEERGIDLLEISGGTYEKSAMFGEGLKQSTKRREAYFIDFAKEVKGICNTPIMVTGGFRSLDFCNDALKNGELDIVGFGRPFLIREDFPMGFIEGKYQKVNDPKISILDKNNADAAEAGFYDLQIKNLAKNKGLDHNYSGLRLAGHIGLLEMRQGLRNWLFD